MKTQQVVNQPADGIATPEDSEELEFWTSACVAALSRTGDAVSATHAAGEALLVWRRMRKALAVTVARTVASNLQAIASTFEQRPAVPMSGAFYDRGVSKEKLIEIVRAFAQAAHTQVGAGHPDDIDGMRQEIAKDEAAVIQYINDSVIDK